MRTIYAAITLALFCPGTLFALSGDFVFKAEKKRVATERTQTKTTQSSAEEWAYHVSITNHSFQDLDHAEIRYLIYFKNEVFGSKTGQAKEERLSGSMLIENLKANASFEFDTVKAELTKSQLVGGYYWKSGAKGRTRASLTGLWVRLFREGKMVAEYSEPDSLKTKDKWP